MKKAGSGSDPYSDFRLDSDPYKKQNGSETLQKTKQKIKDTKVTRE